MSITKMKHINQESARKLESTVFGENRCKRVATVGEG